MKQAEKDCSSIELVVTEKGREKGGSLQRVWSRLGEHRREEQTKQRVAEELGRPEQRREIKEQSRAERARGAEKSREEQSEADQSRPEG